MFQYSALNWLKKKKIFNEFGSQFVVKEFCHMSKNPAIIINFAGF